MTFFSFFLTPMLQDTRAKTQAWTCAEIFGRLCDEPPKGIRRIFALILRHWGLILR